MPGLEPGIRKTLDCLPVIYVTRDILQVSPHCRSRRDHGRW
jgi:hypothetical protein